MEGKMEKNESCITVKNVKTQMEIKKLNMDVIKNQHMPESPTSARALLKKSSSERRNCLCSPTTHVGSFKCRHHRGGMSHANSSSNLSTMDSTPSLQPQ
ncbi:hypothetical protein PHAVU_008G281200 [Phaseolus vulgaris]|uniref:Serine-rich protein-like protein n=1 Tax=Phaseolus vulgaris TaxID=3885 RepID=V7B9D1_PHAVU|nr:hypothetical protein PHAVU_008G281200g [Phaseolus vulgaris]ESW14439.1 hypothetical protein PHAVU_008G281200g [Phaseolus vulgaris]